MEPRLLDPHRVRVLMSSARTARGGLVTILRSCLLSIGLASIALAGCGDGPTSGPTSVVSIDVVTGLVPGPEFDTVLVQVFDGNDPFIGGAERLQVHEARARFGEDFEGGHRVTELTLPQGTIAVRVDLLRRDGTVLVGRRILVTLGPSSRVLRFHLSRDCVGVECPAPAGSAALSECVGGQCADPRCEPPDPTYCPEIIFCNDAEDCAPVGPCAERACVDGLCEAHARTTPDPAACAADAWCDPEVGCRPLDTRPVDAGVGALDASEGPLCGTVGCDVPNECELGYWTCETGTPICEPVGSRPAGWPCDGGLGTCDGLGACIGG